MVGGLAARELGSGALAWTTRIVHKGSEMPSTGVKISATRIIVVTFHCLGGNFTDFAGWRP